MGFEVDLNEVNPHQVTESLPPKPGMYHVKITSIDEDGGRKGEMLVDYEVLSGTVPDQEGLTIRDYFYKTLTAFKRAVALAIATGMTTVDELDRLKAQGKNPHFEFARDAVGKHLVIKLEESEYEGKKTTKCTFGGIWHVNNTDVKSVPKHVAFLEKDGVELNHAPPSQAEAAKSSVQEPKKTDISPEDVF